MTAKNLALAAGLVSFAAILPIRRQSDSELKGMIRPKDKATKKRRTKNKAAAKSRARNR